MSRLLARCAVPALAANSSMPAASMASWRFCARSTSRSSRHRGPRKSPSARFRYAQRLQPYYGIVKVSPVSREDKSKPLDPDKLAKITDEHVRMSLRLQDTFGLRREESMKFHARYADRGRRLLLKASWCKGGRARWIPVLNEGQRQVLDEARRLVGGVR